jgi:F0F1-type ATP synthase delta subunit
MLAVRIAEALLRLPSEEWSSWHILLNRLTLLTPREGDIDYIIKMNRQACLLDAIVALLPYQERMHRWVLWVLCHHYLSIIPHVWSYFRATYAKRLSVRAITWITSWPTTPIHEKWLHQFYRIQPIEPVTIQYDASLLSGYILRINHQTYDHTAIGYLNRMYDCLHNFDYTF